MVKRCVHAFLVGALLTTTSATLSAQNLIQNGSFEQPIQEYHGFDYMLATDSLEVGSLSLVTLR